MNMFYNVIKTDRARVVEEYSTINLSHKLT